jgi:hypothetical protein
MDFAAPHNHEGTLHIDWLIPTERLFPRMWISSGKTAGKPGKRRPAIEASSRQKAHEKSGYHDADEEGG